jgi:hypothetical protein
VVHEVPHQEEASAVGFQQALRVARIRDPARVETRAFILDR